MHLARTALTDKDAPASLPPGYANDASGLSATKVHSVLPVDSDPVRAESQIQELLVWAVASGSKVSVAGAQHTMGGHTLYPGGVVLDMRRFSRMELLPDGETLRVGAGATWAQVIPFLHDKGRSVAVMQSNNDFTVGGSISVNCHGWQHRRAPIACTVRSFRLLCADGVTRRCSREENAELFSLALGGYGLFGVILDVDLETVPNEMYRPVSFKIAADDFASALTQRLQEHPETGMLYGRLSVDRERFLEAATLNLLLSTEGSPDARLAKPALTGLKRAVFRGQEGSDYGKRLRWKLETTLGEQIGAGEVSRNDILNETAAIYGDRSAGKTDILQEYFIPYEKSAAFLADARTIIPRHNVDLLNVTVRDLAPDNDTMLRYADTDLLAFVMLFHHEESEARDQIVASMTRELIDAALVHGGRYYIPYRLHATRDQFERAYPMAAEFFELKRKYDPNELFQNKFYLEYGQPARAGVEPVPRPNDM